MSAKTVETHGVSIKDKFKLNTGPENTRYTLLWMEAAG